MDHAWDDDSRLYSDKAIRVCVPGYHHEHLNRLEALSHLITDTLGAHDPQRSTIHRLYSLRIGTRTSLP